ncbi:urease accessory UreF family protein [Gordonia westfalica]|uniref:Urease accessory UreF family protein n=1 Tax=Gordonia westfalica TaxID=158898 RepID=A0ABU2GV03_9ACTN|nr:urease accessory UreF family protein [Gordonia westfalica]MDS1115265.1 urease accessory UreF family protein [Gordonia westfalica]
MTDHDTAALLTWSQLNDSTFPSGRFVHSNGLEAWLRREAQATAHDIAALSWSFVAGAVAPVDGVACAHAWRLTVPADLVELDHLVSTHKLSSSARRASTSCGTQLAATATTVIDQLVDSPFLGAVIAQHSPGNTAVVEGHVQREIGVTQIAAVSGHLQSSLAGFLSAAVRLGRIGPLWVQREIFTRRQALLQLAAEAIETPPDNMYNAAPELEVYAMIHETSSSRQFTT